MVGKEQTVAQPKKRDFALRLVFSYDGEDVRLVSQQSVEMVVPPSDPIPAEGQTGFWYELKDRKEQTLYRRFMHNPIRFAAEIRSDDPNRPFTWQEVSEPHGTFVLLVPDLKAATLTFFSGSLKPEAAFKRAKAIARFDLT
jgi:hypothetical protein